MMKDTNSEPGNTAPSEDLQKTLDLVNRRLEAVYIRWEALFKSLPDPVIIGDDEGILVCNPRFEELTGLTSEKIVGLPISRLPMCTADMEDCKDLIEHWNHPTPEGGRFIFRFYNPQGKRIALDMQIRFVEMEQSMLRFCIGRDITHELELLSDQERAVAQIDKNMAQLAALNDEIKNPLTLISMSAGLVDGPHQEQVLRGVRMITSIVDRLDQGFTESEKVRKFLKRTIDGFMEDHNHL
jgi:PAS domain S-box-containing protein